MDDQYYRKSRPNFNILGRLKKKLKKRNTLIAVLIVVPALSFVTFSNRGILKHMSLQTEKQEMQEKVQQALEEQKQLQAQSKALDKDPKAIEKIAREKYGMIREGETVYKVKK
jgi:cell division protein FtsB